MRFELSSVFSILLIVGSIDARPSKIAIAEINEGNDENSSKKVIADYSSTWRPIEPRSSPSVAKTDSRYRGRLGNNTEFNNNYYLSSFSPGLVNTFEIDDNFGLPNGWQLLGSSRILKSNVNVGSNETDKLIDDFKSLRFFTKKHEDSSASNGGDPSRENLHVGSNKFYSISPFHGGTPNIRQNDRISNDEIQSPTESGFKRDQNSSRIFVKAKNRVVLKSDYHKKPLETNFRPVSLVKPAIFHETNPEESNAGPNDVSVTPNRDQHTSSGETFADDLPISTSVKKRKKKPGNLVSHSQIIQNPLHVSSTLNDHKLPLDVQQYSPSSGASYEGQSNAQEIIQWLHIPAFGTDMNPSMAKPVASSLHHDYHDFPSSIPVTLATIVLKPETATSGTPIGTKNDTNETPAETTHYHEIPGPNPTDDSDQSPDNSYPESHDNYEPSTSRYPPLNNFYHHSGNYYSQTNNNYHTTQNYLQTSENLALASGTVRPTESVSLPTSVVTLLTDLAAKQTNVKKWPVYRPSSEITQNTVVHVLNGGSKKSNVTFGEVQLPQVEKPLNTLENNINGSATPPNVHITFVNEDTRDKEKPPSLPIPDASTHDKDCPTIMINSITRVNNTIESKEGCTDLNIVINSQVLSTNIFRPSVVQSDDDYGDKNVETSTSEMPEVAGDGYDTTESGNSPSENVPGSYSDQDLDRNELAGYESVEDDDSSILASTSQVTQTSEVLVATGGPQEEAFDALGQSDLDDVSPTLDQTPVEQIRPDIVPSALPESAVGAGQAIGGSSPVGQVPGLAPAAPSVLGPAGPLVGSALGNPGSYAGSATALAPVSDDDDDDDDFGIASLVGSLESLFTHFALYNPFNYGLFGLAAAPLAAVTAGFIGIAAIFFPWTLPGVLDFGRSADKVTMRFKPSLNGVVRQSAYRTEHKDLRHMDQSLRTVATQLLNVTNPKDPITDKKKANNEKLSPNVLLITNNEKTKFLPPRFSSNVRSDVKLVNDVSSESSSLASSGAGFGRPVNSKFGYFESSHPGVAMALTEEEIERELLAAGSSTRLTTGPKNQPTTTGGISTWILLNAPTTTSRIDQETNDGDVVNVKVQSQNKLTTPGKNYEATTNNEIKTASTLEKVSSPQTTFPMERITTMTKSTTPSLRKTTSHPTTTTERTVKPAQTTLKAEKTKVTAIPKAVANSSVRTTEMADFSATPATLDTTKSLPDASRLTLRPKVTTPKPINVTSKPMATKTSRPPGGPSAKPKTPPLRKTTTKSPGETTKNPHTSKIEKVTFRPMQIITTQKSIYDQSNVERPIFMTKVKTSFTADSNEIPVRASLANGTTLAKNETKSTDLDTEMSPISKKPIKNTNVLKVQLKKPTESPTSLEIQPIKVSAPVLRIEKVETRDKSSTKRNSTKTVAPLLPEVPRIDVKFDFSPVVTKFEVETTTQADASATGTKRPHKRKKNKLRRRKPTTPPTLTLDTTSASIATSPAETSTSVDGLETITELTIIDNAIQESKIAPESKVTAGTKNKKKQVQKPIGTQIYNFLSREVMPSFGVMSLVGLGLGLASYFLYPFSGAIARRNYVVEPNYKYNMDEYGGNFGQREEEVFSKVLQGMTNQDGKYGGIKDYETNFHRFQQSYDHSHPDVKYTTRRAPEPSKYSTDVNHRPFETTLKNNEKHRHTEFKYPESPTTPNYYARPKKPDFVGKQSADRQFVVGNIPKEYSNDNGDNTPGGSSVATENLSSENYQRYNYKFSTDSRDVSASYGHAEALKSDDDYEELEITPSAVQVEHGPRALRVVPTKLRRRKRESVIQVIPSRSELEKEEPLSNEILDIIDSVIPGQKIDEDVMNTLEYSVHEKEHHSMKKPSGELSNNKPQASSFGETEKTTLAPKKMDENVGNEENTTFSLEKNMADVGSMEKTSETSKDVEPTTTMTLDPNPTTAATTTTVRTLTIEEILGTTSKSDEGSFENSSEGSMDDTTSKPQEERFNLFTFVKKIAEVKLKLGVAVLKHASEGFARYLGHLQKRINGEE